MNYIYYTEKDGSKKWEIKSVDEGNAEFRFEKKSSKIIFICLDENDARVGDYHLNKKSATDFQKNTKTKTTIHKISKNIPLIIESKENNSSFAGKEKTEEKKTEENEEQKIESDIEVELIEEKKSSILIEDHKDESSEDDNDCTVCANECTNKLHCGHLIHYECIAKSGKKECPICRKNVNLPYYLEHEFRAALESKEKYLKQQQEEMSLQQARELQRQENRPARQQNSITIRYGERQTRVLLNDDGELSLDRMFIETSQISLALHTRSREIEVARNSFKLWQLFMNMNEISAETGVEFESLLGILNFLGTK